MAKEFRAYEYVDGDLTVYVREQGQGDDAWKRAATVKFSERGQLPAQVVLVETRMGIVLDENEIKGLLQELAWPRRW